MTKIEAWITQHEEVATPDQANFINWAKERQRLAQITADLSLNNTRTW